MTKILESSAILTDEESLRPYECDGLSAYRQLPMLVVLPDTVEQVARILKLCAEYKVPVVARGAGTGLSAGALPNENGVLLSLARFNKILNLDPVGRLARLQPGVRNSAISEAAKPYGLFYAPDPSSQIACTIGGNVAENSGGVHCLKYGLTVHNILKLKVLTIEGELLEIGSEALDAAGFDLLALMTGSEGLLGVIVEVTVRLLPIPEQVRVLLASFDDIGLAGQTVTDIIAQGIIPAGLEMMDQLAIQAAEDFIHAGYPVDAKAMLLCELDGDIAQLDKQINVIQELMRKNKAIDVRIAETEQDRMLLWKGRKAAFPAVGRLAPDYYCMDGTIPRRHLSTVLNKITQLSEHYNLRVANVFHAGDGNLHPLILYDANIEGELEKTEAFGAEILKVCVEVGGTITGEHGVGKEKIDSMCMQFSSMELEQFHAIKKAFDPDNLLNPGKLVPTLHRCAELGAMHVHEGKLSHPELPRF